MGYDAAIMAVRTGIGFDAHRLTAGRPLVLGGVQIEHDRGLEGHSDADVVCHALIDALLGAVADGDIGGHYPPSDPRWAGACSLDLLSGVVARLKGRNRHVSHVDVSVLAEEPRLAPHTAAMRKALADVLEIGEDRVSVKATTLEGMGALGRREGIAALAVAAVAEAGGSE